MGPPESAIWFGGLVLAHAVWIVSDIEERSLLCPFAMLDVAMNVGCSHSILRAKQPRWSKGMQAWQTTAMPLSLGIRSRCLLSYSDSIQEKIDVLVVSSWTQDLDERYCCIRGTCRMHKGRFRLLSSIKIAVHETIAPDPAQTFLRALAISGLGSHPQSSLWRSWS